MRALITTLGLPLVALGWFGLQLSGWAWPLRLSVELLPQPVMQAPAPTPAPAETLLKAFVTATYPHLEGLALGDAVQFDRYGILAPTVGSVVCLPRPPGGRVAVTPLGGRLTHVGSVDVTLVAPGAPGCESPRLEPIVSVKP